MWYNKYMYEYKVKRFTSKRAKGGNLGKILPLSPMERSERAISNFLNSESQDGWELFLARPRWFIFRRKIK